MLLYFIRSLSADSDGPLTPRGYQAKPVISGVLMTHRTLIPNVKCQGWETPL
jgi:hypothetical protein